jgi:SprT protein
VQTIYKIFFLLTFVSTVLFILVFYKDLEFQNSPLDQSVLRELQIKHNQIKQKIQQNYNLDIAFNIIIEDQLPNNLYGLASYKKGIIKIYLNKKRFQENKEYMISYVLPHEYAHALMFYFGDFSKENAGHTKKWQNICYKIGGIKCDRFVDHNDILIEKLGGIY